MAINLRRSHKLAFCQTTTTFTGTTTQPSKPATPTPSNLSCRPHPLPLQLAVPPAGDPQGPGVVLLLVGHPCLGCTGGGMLTGNPFTPTAQPTKPVRPIRLSCHPHPLPLRLAAPPAAGPQEAGAVLLLAGGPPCLDAALAAACLQTLQHRVAA